MTSLFSPNHQSSSSISEGSSAPPSPASSVHCARSTASLSVSNTASPGINFAHNVPRYGTWIPNRVFVGGISNSTTETDLQERFDAYGTIKEIKIIRDRSGLCKGYGFITFDSEEAAKRAQNESEIIVLKERRLNIAPAVIKQSFNRPYDLTQPGTLMYHHNSTSYAFDNGMAFFSPGPAQSPYSAREAAVYSSPYGPSQSSAAGHTFSPVMYPYTPQPLAYMPTGQQFSYQPISYDPYYKSTNATAPQFLYGPPSALNGALNGPSSSSQSSSPGYGQPPGPGLPGPGPGHSGPPLPPSTAQYYHPAGDLYYNGGTHPQQTALYQMDGHQVDEYDPRDRDTATPVVSLLKLQERGIEEMEITRTPKKMSMVSSSGSSLSLPAYRSMYTAVQLNQRPPRGRRIINSTGQPTGVPSASGRGGRGNPCQHRPPGAMSGLQGGHGGPGRPQHNQRRIITMSRSSTRSSTGVGSMHCRPSPAPTVSPAPSQSHSPSPSTTAPTPSPSASPSPSPPDIKTVFQDENNCELVETKVAESHLPPSPPTSPPPVGKGSGTDEGEMCQQMQALAM